MTVKFVLNLYFGSTNPIFNDLPHWNNPWFCLQTILMVHSRLHFLYYHEFITVCWKYVLNIIMFHFLNRHFLIFELIFKQKSFKNECAKTIHLGFNEGTRTHNILIVSLKLGPITIEENCSVNLFNNCFRQSIGYSKCLPNLNSSTRVGKFYMGSFLFKIGLLASVTRLKSPNVYKSCPNKISLEKWMILTPLQKLPNNVGNLGKIIVAIGFE